MKVSAAGLAASSVGALGFVGASESLAANVRPYRLEKATETRNTCPYCAVGCGVLVYSSADGVNWSQMGEIPLAEMNVLISYAYFSSPQRTRYFKLTTPVNPGPGVWYLGAFKLYTK